jgi:hypothetical protein
MNKQQAAFVKAIEKNSNSVAIKKLTHAVGEMGAKRLNATLELAKLVSAGLDWFSLPETKAKMKELEIKLSVEEFVIQQYGFQKSFAYKLKRASDIPAELVEEYLASDIEERSLASLLSFAKAKEEQAVAELTGEGSGEGEGDGEGEVGGESDETSPIYVNLTITDDNGQKHSIRIRRNGKAEVKGDSLKIHEGFEAILEFLGVPEATA